MHDMALICGIFLNLLVTVFGFGRIIVQYEHRFTKLETEHVQLERTLKEILERFKHEY